MFKVFAGEYDDVIEVVDPFTSMRAAEFENRKDAEAFVEIYNLNRAASERAFIVSTVGIITQSATGSFVASSDAANLTEEIKSRLQTYGSFRGENKGKEIEDVKNAKRIAQSY